jgi:hypothetical protein
MYIRTENSGNVLKISLGTSPEFYDGIKQK